MDIKAKYTLEKVEGDLAYVKVEAQYSTDPSKSSDYMGLEMKPDLKGTLSGTIMINKNNGFLGSGELKQTMSGNIKLTVPQQGDVEMPMTYTGEVNYSTVKQ